MSINTTIIKSQVATNALLERQGEPTALVVTTGFKDLLHIGNQSRPDIFDLVIAGPELLYKEVVECDEEVILPLGDTPGPRAGDNPAATDSSWLFSSSSSSADSDKNNNNLKVVKGTTGELVCIRKPPNLPKLQTTLQHILNSGITSLAVVLKHAAIFPDHELAVGNLATSMGFTHVSLSHKVMPMVKMVPRGFTAAADAYLTPHIMRYVQAFEAGFDDGLLRGVPVYFMQSDGGLAGADAFSGHRAILSGPAGGYVGYARTTSWEGSGTGTDSGSMQMIGFDMGGTSTDVSRYAGTFEHVFESTTAGITIQAPQLDINTVAAGGGSRLFFDSGVFKVGPESAGAHPGPVCYRKGGYLAITDANLVLGRILPEFFPKIFGLGENEPLDLDGARQAMAAVTDQVNAHATAATTSSASASSLQQQQPQQEKSIDEVAMGFIRVANEAMCRPIRALTQAKGYDAAKHVLSCFGGAGGQHACAIAIALGINTVFVHRYSGILSAVGIALADVVQEIQEPSASQLDESAMLELENRLCALSVEGKRALKDKDFNEEDGEITVARYLNLRYEGTDVPIMTEQPSNSTNGTTGGTITAVDYITAFEEAYRREYGFILENRKVLVDDIRIRAAGHHHKTTGKGNNNSSGDGGSGATNASPPPLPSPAAMMEAYFEPLGKQLVPAFLMKDLHSGHQVAGPAIMIDDISTIVVEAHCTAHITSKGDVRIAIRSSPSRSTHAATTSTNDYDNKEENEECDPIQLSIFSHRFMGIAEQMGRVLQRTSISVNIKERLDFSCALFDASGNLVSNAPHLPVHLGAMSEAVKYQIRHYGPGGAGRAEGLEEGDVLVSNHPQLAGGSHLPDITVITPVFNKTNGNDDKSNSKVVFFVASRGHHADIGGISPGSMPPHSHTLLEEGAAIVSHKLVKNGWFDEPGISELLLAPGKIQTKTSTTSNDGGISSQNKISGTRNLSDNISDLRAQVAANNRGIALVQDLIQEYSLPVVQSYMKYIQSNAEQAVREMLIAFSLQQGMPEVGTVTTSDQMDDGTSILLSVTIDRSKGSAVFDFNGTGPQVWGNTNAPPAVTHSAIIYSLRCMVTRDIPLNHGCMAPITVILPPHSILSPSSDAAVVGGNVLTSQRVTDVVLKAFNAAAASQGCMNNLTFGDESGGYYETIAGGAGAGPGWHGRSGVHTHMTNTRITDPEVLERRYPVVLKRFCLRPGSGGQGKWKGGDGVVRELEFLRPLTVSILSERRAVAPFGILGGESASKGVNLWVRREGGDGDGKERVVSLGGKATIQVKGGDRLVIMTPGGGGCGNKHDDVKDRVEGGGGGREFSVAVKLGGGSLSNYTAAQETV